MKNKGLKIICSILCFAIIASFMIPYIHKVLYEGKKSRDIAHSILMWPFSGVKDIWNGGQGILGVIILMPVFVCLILICSIIYGLMWLLINLEEVYISSILLSSITGWILGWFIFYPIIYKVCLPIGSHMILGISLAFNRDGFDMTNEEEIINRRRSRIVLAIAIIFAIGLTSVFSLLPSFHPYSAGNMVEVSQNYYHLVSSNIASFFWKLIHFSANNWKVAHSIILNIIINTFHVLGIILLGLLLLVTSILLIVLMALTFLLVYLIPYYIGYGFFWAVNDIFKSMVAANIVFTENS